MYTTLLALKEAFKGFTKNVWWNTVVLLLMVISFTGFSVFYIANENIGHITNELNNEMVVTINLKEDVTDVETLIQSVENTANVAGVIYKTKEQVLAEAEKEMGEEAAVLATFEGVNIFPSQLIVSASSPEKIKDIAYSLENEVFVDRVIFGEKYIDDFLVMNEKLRNYGMIFAFVGAILVIMIIMVVIKMNIEQRREEIYIKSLIGASNYVIRMPFVLETVLLGCVSFVLVYFGISYGYGQVVSMLGAEKYLLSIDSFSVDFGFELLIVILFVTLVAGILSTSRHLRKI